MAELDDEYWPSLAPIRTSCSSSSSTSYCYYVPNTFTSNSSCSNPLYQYTFQSPPSSSSSHVSFLHATSTANTKGQSMLSKCFPPRPISAAHGFPKQCMSASPGGDMRRSRWGGGIFGTVASVPTSGGPQSCRAGSICGIAAAVAATQPGTLKLGQKSGALKSNACKGHPNAFTMIPCNVVGKKKPPDYISDEPTSPEVTCMGRVRRSKHSKSTWDALLSSSEKLCKKKKNASRSQTSCPERRNLDHDLQLATAIPRPLPMDSSTGAPPKWRKMISFFKDIKALHTPHLQRKLRQEDLVIDLSRLHAACSGEDRDGGGATNDQNYGGGMQQIHMHSAGGEVLYICQSGEGEEEYSSIAQEECGIDDHLRPDALAPPPNCLSLMRNMSGRSKVFHNHDDRSEVDKDPDRPALKVISSPADYMRRINRKQAFYFWKSKKSSSSSCKNLVTM